MTPDHLVTSPGLCLCPGSDPGPPLVTRTRRRVRRQRTKEAGARPAGRPVNGHPPVVPPPPAPGARFSSKLNLDRTNLAVPLCRDDASYVATQYFWPISYIMTFRSVAYCIRCIIAVLPPLSPATVEQGPDQRRRPIIVTGGTRWSPGRRRSRAPDVASENMV